MSACVKKTRQTLTSDFVRRGKTPGMATDGLCIPRNCVPIDPREASEASVTCKLSPLSGEDRNRQRVGARGDIAFLNSVCPRVCTRVWMPVRMIRLGFVPGTTSVALHNPVDFTLTFHHTSVAYPRLAGQSMAARLSYRHHDQRFRAGHFKSRA